MAELVGGAALGAVFGELLKLVIATGKKVVMFQSQLHRMETFLISIQPMIEDIINSNSKLDCPEKDISMFVNPLLEAKELVLKCSVVQSWNPCKTLKYTNKLLKMEELLLSFFQMNVPGQLLCDIKKARVELGDIKKALVEDVRDNSNKLDHIILMIENRSSSEFVGSCSVPRVPRFVVGLDQQFGKLKEMLLRDGVLVVLVSAPGGSGKITLAKMVSHDDQIKGIFADIIFPTVTKTTNLMRIVSKLFEHEGIHSRDEFNTDEDAITQLEELMSRLMLEKGPVLFVFVDECSGWGSLMNQFKYGGNDGYKILVTSKFVLRRFDSTYNLISNDIDVMGVFSNSAFHRSNIPLKEIFLKKKVVIKISYHEKKHRCKAMSIAASVSGVESIGLGGLDNNRLEVIGEEFDALLLTTLLRKKVGHGEIMDIEEKKPKANKSEATCSLNKATLMKPLVYDYPTCDPTCSIL